MTTYNPVPPRVWSRVQNPCTYIIPNLPDVYDVYIPLTNQTLTTSQAIYEDKLMYKGNILQYKGNSARLTKSQKYSQLARCGGPNRTKVFATQSQTYTNPNTKGLLRVGFQTYPYPNQIVGAPNNISGPFLYNVPNPNNCDTNEVVDGGNLICGTFVNQCSGEIMKSPNTNANICNLSSASNVPGSSILCWNKKVNSWFPKPRYIMNNSTDKWPINYKGFVSAVHLTPPVVSIINLENTIEITWTSQQNKCYPINAYNVYINGILYKTVDYNIQTMIINKSDLSENSTITVESTSGNYIQSGKTNVSYIKNNKINSIDCSCSFFNKLMNNNSITSINTILLDCNKNLLDLNSSTDILSLNTYNNIKTNLELYKRSLDTECCLIQIIDLFQLVLTNLYQSLSLKQELINLIDNSKEYKNAYDILNDKTKLQEYINELSKNMYITNMSLTSTYAKLKPSYNIYISLYGLPENLNFEPSKLTSINITLDKYNSLYGEPIDANYDLNKFMNILE
jgi:hypothetical protein